MATHEAQQPPPADWNAAGLTGEAAQLARSANERRAAGDVMAAAALLEQAIARVPPAASDQRALARLHLHLGELMFADGWVGAAVEHLQKAFKLDVDLVSALDVGRRIYAAVGDFRQVARLYELELETQSSTIERRGTLQRLGQLRLERLDDVAGAVHVLEEAVRLGDADDGTLERLAGAYITPELGAAEQAALLFYELALRAAARRDGAKDEVAYLKRALGADPSHRPAALRLEERHTKDGLHEERLRLYAMPVPVPGWALRKVRLLVELGRFGEVEEALQQAVAGGAEARDCDELLVALKAKGGQVKLLARLAHIIADALPLEGAARAERLHSVAKHYAEAAQPNEREGALRAALAEAPSDAALFAELAELYGQRRDQAGLDDLFVHVESVAPEEQAARLTLLAELFDKRLGDSGRASEAWQQLERISPSPRAPLELKRLQQKGERWASVQAALERELAAATTASARGEALKRLAQLARDRHDLPEAERLLVAAVAEKPEDPHIHRARVELFEVQRAPDKMRDALREQLKHTSERVERLNLLRRLANLCDVELDDFLGAVEACQGILEQLPADRDALARMSALYRRHDDEDGLVATLERHIQAVAMPAERLPLLIELGEIYARRGAHAQAAEKLERAVKQDAKNVRALTALAGVHEAMAKWPEAVLVLERAAQLDEGDVTRLRRLARIADGQLHDLPRAAAAWSKIISRRPGDKEALGELERLARAQNDAKLLDEALDRRMRVAPREQQIALLNERARLAAAQPGAAGLARARGFLQQIVDELAPADRAQLRALRELTTQMGDLTAAVRAGERELFVAQAEGARAEAIEAARAIAELLDKRRDTTRAERAWERAVTLEGDRDGWRRLAALYQDRGAWAQALAAYQRQLDLTQDADEREALALDAAQVEEQHGDRGKPAPRRAFALVEKIFLEAHHPRLLDELRRLAAAHGLWSELEVVLGVMLASLGDGDSGERLRLLDERRRLREEKLGDAGAAFDDALAATKLKPDDETAWAEAERLCALAKRWSQLVAAWGERFARSNDVGLRRRLATRAGEVLEEHLGDKQRAFLTYLRAYSITLEMREAGAARAKPDEVEAALRAQLWRLAKTLAAATPPASASPPATPAAKPALPAAKPAQPANGKAHKPARRDATVEVSLDEVVVDDGTVELSVDDIVPMAKKRPPAPPPIKQPRRDDTIELTLSDGSTSQAGGAPAVDAALAPWRELAAVIRAAAPRQQREAQLRALVGVAEMWECGAEDPRHAFETLLEARALDPDDGDLLAELDRLAELSDARARLTDELEAAVESASTPEQAVRLLIALAELRQRREQRDEAEQAYMRALGIQPAHELALGRLEELYRDAGRDADLATLLDRRLNGLLERLPAGPARHARAVEQAEIYERLGQSYEAIAAWRRVAEENPDESAAFMALARLYERVAQWSKAVEALVRVADLDEDHGTAEALARARATRRRIGDIYADELELSERALEVYERLYQSDANDPSLETALEGLYEQLRRWRELEALLRKRAGRAQTPEERLALSARRAQLLESLGEYERATQLLAELRRARPDDGDIEERLCRAYEKSAHWSELYEVLRVRLADKGLAPERRAEAELRAARALKYLAREPEARALVEGLLAREPTHAAALALLERLQSGADSFAGALERRAEAESGGAAAETWLAAAQLHKNERNDIGAARRCVERAMTAEPGNAAALALGVDLAAAAEEWSTVLALSERELAAQPPPGEDRQAELLVQMARAHQHGNEPHAAASAYRRALAALSGRSTPAAADAALGLSELAAAGGAWDEVEELLSSRALRDSLSTRALPALLAIAAHAEQQGKLEEAYTALLEADRLRPGDLGTRLRLGENRYRAHRFREAAQILGGLPEVEAARLAPHPDAASASNLAEALYHGALAELKLRHPERAHPLLERVLALDASHQAALGLIADRALEDGVGERAIALLTRQAEGTTAPDERAQRWERIGDLLRQDAGSERARVAVAYANARAALGGRASEELLDKSLRAERESGHLDVAARLLDDLLRRGSSPDKRAERLREAAALDVALELPERAESRLRELTALVPQDEGTIDTHTELLAKLGRDNDAAVELTRALSHLPAPTPELTATRARLWRRLGECRDRLRDAAHATVAYERSLQLLPSQRPLRDLLLERLQAATTRDDDAILRHLAAVLLEEPTHPPSLRRALELEARRAKPATAKDLAAERQRRLLALLALAGVASSKEHDELRRLNGVTAEGRVLGTLDDADHAALAPDDAYRLGAIFAALWEGWAPRHTTPLELPAEARISPIGSDALSRAVERAARAVGNPRTAAFRLPAQSELLTLSAAPPTVLTCAPALEAAPADEILFRVARALTLLKPEYVLAATLSPPEFARLFAAVLRAFHPRHNERGQSDAEAQQLRRELPYQTARRLTTLFTELRDTEFSSARWRRAVERAADRAALLVVGDINVAARVLAPHAAPATPPKPERREPTGRIRTGTMPGLVAVELPEALLDLARFSLGDDFLRLRGKLTSS